MEGPATALILLPNCSHPFDALERLELRKRSWAKTDSETPREFMNYPECCADLSEK
jgi:hypothetical protein